MALFEQSFEDDVHPIDTVEYIAEHHDWDFDRISDDQIAIAIEAQWRTYSITLTWSGFDEILRIICTFEMQPPEDKLTELYALLNLMNDQCWAGAFTYWPEQKCMLYRYGLVLDGGQGVGPDQINTMINVAVLSAE
ncbi:MAG: YbjN domain-containing protein, partial [Rhodobacteraceae bacterium]|nr:YbjN domain-containing protein [Paracoccaceae bacterium]